MKQQATKTPGFRKALPVIAACLLLTVAACKKKEDTTIATSKFQGTWVGTNSCSGGSTTYLINGGIDANTLTTAITLGTGTCAYPVTITLSASGNAIAIPTQTFTDNCNKSYSITGTGNLDSTTLSLTISGIASTPCTFTGHK
jgi:hypothetical protein